MSLISFTPLADGVTGVNAAATNTPLSTIFNDYNGNITNANISASAAIAGSKISPSTLPISGLILTQVNSGTAGGTMSYMNLGGVKMLWFTTATQTSSAGGVTYTVTLPTSFFSTITSVTATAINMGTDARQYISVQSATTTTITLTFIAPGAATTGASMFVIGT